MTDSLPDHSSTNEKESTMGYEYEPSHDADAPSLLARADYAAVERESELMAALSAVVAAHDHPPDGTAHARMRAAIAHARKLLGQTPVKGVDGHDA
jgi:hypothetical protein